MSTGTLWHLESTPAGVTLKEDHAAGATTLTVHDAVEASETGGDLVLPDGTRITYTAADLGADTITLATGLPAALPEGAVLTVPGTMVHTGTVQLEGEDTTRPVRVEHAVAATLPVGQRPTHEEAERVLVRETPSGGLVLVDVVNRPADLGDVLDVRAELERVGVPVYVLTAGTLLAETLIGVPVGDTDQVLIGTQAGGVAYYTLGPVGEDGTAPLVPVTRMGRVYSVIDPATGDTLAMLDGDGVTAPVGRFDDVLLGGQPIREALAETDPRLVARGEFATVKGPYTQRTGYAEVGWSAKANRAYVITIDARHRTNGDGAYTEMWLVVSTSAPGTTPASPDANDPSIVPVRVFESVSGSRATTAHFETYWATGSDVEVRLGLVLRGSSPTGSEMIEARILVRDEGRKIASSGRLNLMGAPEAGSTTPTTPPATSPPQERTRTWAYAWEEVYSSAGGTPARAGHAYLDGTDSAGRSVSAASGHAYQQAWRYQTAWGIQHAANAMTAAGASDQRLWVRFYVHKGFYDRQPRVMLGLAKTGATSNSSSVLNTAPTILRSLNIVGLSRRTWVEQELPASWVADILAGDADTITLGDARAVTTHGQALIYNVGHATKAPSLRGSWSEQQ